MSIEDQIGQIESHLSSLVNRQTTELNEDQISSFIARITVDKSAFLVAFGEIKSLLNTVVKLLYKDLQIDYNVVIELLDAVLSNLQFESVLEIFPLEYIIDALSSQNENLQLVALKSASKASPPDLIANTEIVPRAIELLATETSSVRLVNEIEKTLSVLLSGELIRRRIQTEYVLSVLKSMGKSPSTTIKTRLFDFMVLVLPFASEGDFDDVFFAFNDFENADILYTLNLIKFYIDILDIIDSTLRKEWLLAKIAPRLEEIAKLYRDREENPDIQYFAIATITELFKKISYVSPQIFELLDLNYINITKSDIMILATINPHYISEHHSDILKTLRLNSDTIPIYRNLVKSETGFSLIQDKLVSNQILRLPYLDLIALLLRMSEYEHSRTYLLHELPQVMNKLLSGVNVVEPESSKLRKLTLENLNHLSDGELDVWRAGVRLEYSRIINGKSINPLVGVLDGAL